MTDVDEVVGTATEGDLEEVPFVEPPNRFDKIKESYKGVTSALDLSEETAAYEDFQSLLTDHKVRIRLLLSCSCTAVQVGSLVWLFAHAMVPHIDSRCMEHHPYMSQFAPYGEL